MFVLGTPELIVILAFFFLIGIVILVIIGTRIGKSIKLNNSVKKDEYPKNIGDEKNTSKES